jgi:hypothetical protein
MLTLYEDRVITFTSSPLDSSKTTALPAAALELDVCAQSDATRALFLKTSRNSFLSPLVTEYAWNL